MRQKYEVSIKFGTTTPDAPDLASEHSEYERFEDVTRALVAVPKSEVDEKRKTKSGRSTPRK